MTKDELQAKRAVALSELKDIEVALCLDEHYIDIIEKENSELRNNGFTVSAMTEQQLKVALKKGEQLEKENAELKEELKDANEKVVHLACNQNKDLKYKLTKAKEHIRTLISCLIDWVQEGDKDYCYIEDAEQFLKEIEK